MNAMYLTLFVSAALVLGSGLLFGFLYLKRSHEYTDRLSLLPLESDDSEHPAKTHRDTPGKGS